MKRGAQMFAADKHPWRRRANFVHSESNTLGSKERLSGRRIMNLTATAMLREAMAGLVDNVYIIKTITAVLSKIMKYLADKALGFIKHH